MKEITDKRKEIETDLIDVLRYFDDDVLYEIIMKYSEIKTKEKQEEAKEAVYEQKSLIKKMMSKEISRHKAMLDEFKTADEKRKKEIYDEEVAYLRKSGRILDGDYLFEVIKTLPKYALEKGEVEDVDEILRGVEHFYLAHREFDDTFYKEKHFILQDIVVDLLKRDIDLGREDLVKEHMEYALHGRYGFLARREDEYKTTKPHGFALSKLEYIAICKKYRKSLQESKAVSI
ncbi:MAG: hypothetical protein IKA36_05325 [Clostridia bacterium]|nr:hypothetical protein [Clostridia bacterium]